MRHSLKKFPRSRAPGFYWLGLFFVALGLTGSPAGAGVIVDRILAVAGDTLITQSDLDPLLYAKPLPGQAKPDPQLLLHRLIKERLMLQEARKRGLQVADEEIEFALNDIQSRNGFPDRASFQEAVSRGDLSWEGYVSDLAGQLLNLKLLGREISSKLKLGENEARSYYEAYPERFELPDRIRLRQLLLRFSPGDSDAIKNGTRAQARKLYEEARQGAAFTQLVEQYSDPRDKRRGGDLGFFQKGVLAPKIEAAVSGLKEKEISEPVESARGIHLFKIEKRESHRKIPFEKVRRDIEAKLLSEKRNVLREKWLENLWERSFVEIKN